MPHTTLCPSKGDNPFDSPEYLHAYFKDILNKQLNSLMEAAVQTISTMLENDPMAADPLDQATNEIDHSYTLRIRDRESRLIRKIRTALSKIEDGSFGICEECEEPVSIERLKARPVTAYCIRCKSKMEANERLQGK